jgi:hypothetical protein
MGSRQGRSILIAWYRPKDYPAIRALMEDGYALPADYATWLRHAESVVRLELGLGSDVIKVTIDPARFAAWCLAAGQRLDGQARRRYANSAISHSSIEAETRRDGRSHAMTDRPALASVTEG